VISKLLGIAAAAVLVFFAVQLAHAPKMALSLKIGVLAVIAVVGVAGILALLAPDEEDAPPAERLYTADEVARLVAAVQSGQLVPVAPAACKFCGGADPEATGVDGSRYHRRCFRDAFERGLT
jgi:hypothetical protein